MPSTTLTITGPQRVALHRQVIQNLSGIDDISLLYEAGKFVEAGELARRYVEDLRLLEDLSWRPCEDRDAFDLTMPPGELWLVLHRLREEAQAGLRGDEERRAMRRAEQVQANYERTEEVCAELLGALRDQDQGGERDV